MKRSKPARRAPKARKKPAARKPSSARGAGPIAQLRRICLALPEAHEVIAWGEPTFRVRNKMFATYANPKTHHGVGRASTWIKSTHFTQDQLVRDDPTRFFVPPYVGPSGWVGIYLDKRPNWTVVAALLEDAYRLIAPKRISAKLLK